MNDFEEYIISFIMGITTGVIGTICSNNLHALQSFVKKNMFAMRKGVLKLWTAYWNNKRRSVKFPTLENT